MAIRTISSIDELEREDERFARKPNGRFKSNFYSRAEEPKARIREHDRYLDEMRQDARNWRREGNAGAAERAENQAAWEQADRVSTFSSRRRDLSSDPEVKDRYHERMLEADADCDMAEQRQFQSDQRHESRWDELRVEQRREREAEERLQREKERIMAHADKPLRETLQGDELKKYETDREAYGKAMNRGREGDYLEREGESERFDRRYRMYMVEWAEARHRREEQQRARGEEPAAAKKAQQKQQAVASSEPTPAEATVKTSEPAKAEEPEEAPAHAQASEQAGQKEVEGKPADAEQSAQATDGRRHAPILASHEGFRAEVSDDQTSIRYLREKDGRLGFTDHGGRVSVGESAHAQMPDPETVRAALIHASEKFKKFRVNGNREQQETSARMAERLGFGDRLSNPELQDIIRHEREQISRERAAEAIREAKGESGGGHGQTLRTPAESDSTRLAETPESESVRALKADSAGWTPPPKAPAASESGQRDNETPLERRHREQRDAVVARHADEVDQIARDHAEQMEPLYDGSGRSEEMPSDVESRHRESWESMKQGQAEELKELEHQQAREREQVAGATVRKPPSAREVTKPAGFDERKAAQATGEGDTESTGDLARPQEQSERSGVQRAR